MKLPAFEVAYNRKQNSTEVSGLKEEHLPDNDSYLLFTKFGSLQTFIAQYGNSSYGDGLYRTHNQESALKWTALLEGYYPEFIGKIACFGFDWEGNMFVQRKDDGESVMMIFEIATGDYFELEQSIEGFHEEDLIDYSDETLHVEKFHLAMAHIGTELQWRDCIGHKVSLLLGGDDVVENMEITDMEVYWSIQQQIMDSLNDLPE